MRDVVLNFINQTSLDKIAHDSFYNWHVKGVNYLCLHRNPEVTAKLYIFRPNEISLNKHGFLVNPHSHRYNFQSWVLAGKVSNIHFLRDDILGEPWQQYTYKSPLSKEKSIKYAQLANFRQLVCNYDPYETVCDSYYMHYSKIHTLNINTEKYTVLFLMQFKTRTEETIFLTKGDLPNYEGLYIKYNSTKEIKQLIEELKDNI